MASQLRSGKTALLSPQWLRPGHPRFAEPVPVVGITLIPVFKMTSNSTAHIFIIDFSSLKTDILEVLNAHCQIYHL